MQELPITHHHVTGVTDNRYRTFEPFTARLGDQRLDIELALLMGTREHPDTIHGGAAIHLSHEIKAVDILVKVRTIPVGHSILMPGDRGTNTRLFDEQRLIERRKVRAIDGLCHLE